MILCFDDIRTRYKARRSAGGIRRPLRLLRKEKWCEAGKEKVHA